MENLLRDARLRPAVLEALEPFLQLGAILRPEQRLRIRRGDDPPGARPDAHRFGAMADPD